MEKFKEYLFYPLIILVTVVALYHNVVNNEFSGLDDILMISENWDNLTSFSHIITAFTDDVYHGSQGSYYRPIQVLSYMPDAFIEQSVVPNPRIFFIMNLVLFVLNGVLIFWFLGLFDLSKNYRLVFTILYTLHPALTPGVAWVPGRVDIVLSILAISSIWAFIRYLKSRSNLWLILHLLFFALGLFNKETAIVIPAISILIFLYTSSYFDSISGFKELVSKYFILSFFTAVFEWLKRNVTLVTSWIIITIVWYILRKNALDDDPFSILGILNQLAFSWVDLIILTGASIIPYQLHVYLDITFWYIILALPGSFLFFYLPYRLGTSIKNLVLGYAWFLIFIYPTTIANLINYHRLTIPLLGLAFLFSSLDSNSIKKGYLTVIGVFGLFFLYENIQFQKSFINAEKFWTNAVEGSPNSMLANNGMAWQYHLKHANDSALYYYRQALVCDKTQANTRISIALIEEENKNTQKADSLLYAEFEVTNDSNLVYYYIGQILLERGDTANAISNLSTGYPVTEYSRNARLFYDTLDVSVKSKLNLKSP